MNRLGQRLNVPISDDEGHGHLGDRLLEPRRKFNAWRRFDITHAT